MAKINVLSPYFINVSNANLVSVQLEIEIYDGLANTSWQSSPQYTLQSTAINNKVTFEISELIKDYIKAQFTGDYPELITTLDEATTRYVDYRITETHTSGVQTPVDNLANRAFYGYGYFEDGANPQLNQGYLQSNTKILKSDDAPVRVAIDPVNTNSVAFFYKNQQTYSFTPTLPYRIQDHVQYISNEASGVDSYEDRVLLDGGTFEGSNCLTDFLQDTTIYPVDTIYVDDNNGVTVIDVDNIQECKYTPYKLTFINKFGAYQNLWFFKNSQLSMTTRKEMYKANIVEDGSYNIYNAQNRILTKNGDQKLTLNSGYYPESNNELFKQLFLSEKVWIEYNNQTLGVNISSSNITYKTSLTDKLINYTIELDFAFNTINNIR